MHREKIKPKARLVAFFLVLHIAPLAHSAKLDEVALHQLNEMNADWSSKHEASPMGVPKNFSWAAGPVIEKGNSPGDFTALTGWGQAFWSTETVGHPGPLELRNFRVFLCQGQKREWYLVQAGEIEGAEFRADFKNNAARKPPRFEQKNGVATVGFEAGKVFHFWPSQGRARLRDGKVCGVLVLMEARAPESGLKEGSRGGYLVGLGADYWIDMTATWNNFKTNKGVGLGRLKRVSNHWQLFGMSTATDADLERLLSEGYLR